MPKTSKKQMDCLGDIIAYEQGELDHDGFIELFCNLIRSKLAWSLQGHYGRTAMELINNGIISREGVRLA